MLVEEIKKLVVTSVKSGDTVARDVLRLALGEIQTAEARKNSGLSDEEAGAALRKLIKSNEETLGALPAGDEREATLRREVEVLSSLLPKPLGLDEIVAACAPAHEGIVSAKAEGQAVGIAMKHLKAQGLSAAGADVTAAVKQIRSSG